MRGINLPSKTKGEIVMENYVNKARKVGELFALGMMEQSMNPDTAIVSTISGITKGLRKKSFFKGFKYIGSSYSLFVAIGGVKNVIKGIDEIKTA